MADNLKERIRQGGTFSVPLISLHRSREENLADLTGSQADLGFLDLQHSPFDECALAEFCRWSNAELAPVLLRIRDPRESFLIGRYCDLGARAIIVPMLDDVAVLQQAIDAFYYPPIGKRSWGPKRAWRVDEFSGLDYAEWWNRNGVLIMQLESVDAIERCREFALPGVDLIAFGGMDVKLSLQAHPHSRFADESACIAHVRQELRGTGVAMINGIMPFGTIEVIRP